MSRQNRQLVDSTRRNINQIMDNLRRKGLEVERAAKSALKNGVDKIVTDAQIRVPVKTGKLRDSICAEGEKDGAVYKITADAKNAEGVSYGQYVEYSPKINHPFLYPAINANIYKLNKNLKNAIKNALQGE